MSPITVDQFLARVRSALSVPTLYWLGHGGWTGDEDPTPQPGRDIRIEQELAARKVKGGEDEAIAKQYEAAMLQASLTFAELPLVACDCSGFVCWALGLRRSPATLDGGWINTDAIHSDALHGQKMFTRLELDKAVPGALLVYPKPDKSKSKPGHVAVVTEVGSQGCATRMIHCAPENFLIEPVPRGARNAIAETGTEHFAEQGATVLAMYRFSP